MFSVLKKRQLAAVVFQTIQGGSSTVSLRSFSAPTEAAAKAKAAEEWGEKYSDECFKFEKEWEAISKKVEDE
jgi:hypothetical protein